MAVFEDRFENIVDFLAVRHKNVPLSKMVNLSQLALDKNLIGDIRDLSGLIKLTSLSLDQNQIKDVFVLSNLNDLKTLSLTENQIKDIEPLTLLPSLDTLNLENNCIDLATEQTQEFLSGLENREVQVSLEPQKTCEQ